MGVEDLKYHAGRITTAAVDVEDQLKMAFQTLDKKTGIISSLNREITVISHQLAVASKRLAELKGVGAGLPATVATAETKVDDKDKDELQHCRKVLAALDKELKEAQRQLVVTSRVMDQKTEIIASLNFQIGQLNTQLGDAQMRASPTIAETIGITEVQYCKEVIKSLEAQLEEQKRLVARLLKQQEMSEKRSSEDTALMDKIDKENAGLRQRALDDVKTIAELSERLDAERKAETRLRADNAELLIRRGELLSDVAALSKELASVKTRLESGSLDSVRAKLDYSNKLIAGQDKLLVEKDAEFHELQKLANHRLSVIDELEKLGLEKDGELVICYERIGELEKVLQRRRVSHDEFVEGLMMAHRKTRQKLDDIEKIIK